MGTNNRKRIVVLSVVGLAVVYLYLSLRPAGPHPTSIQRKTQVPATPVDAVEARGGNKLRIDLLATLQAVEVAGHRRDLFQFSAAEIKEVAKQARPEPQIVPNPTTQLFKPPDVIPFRFYGYTSALKQWRNKLVYRERRNRRGRSCNHTFVADSFEKRDHRAEAR